MVFIGQAVDEAKDFFAKTIKVLDKEATNCFKVKIAGRCK